MAHLDRRARLKVVYVFVPSAGQLAFAEVPRAEADLPKAGGTVQTMGRRGALGIREVVGAGVPVLPPPCMPERTVALQTVARKLLVCTRRCGIRNSRGGLHQSWLSVDPVFGTESP